MFKIKGVVPPMITPFDEDGILDEKGLVTLVNYLKNEVDGLFINGSYGSGALMNLEERKKVTEICVKVADDKVPIISMVGTTNNRDSIELVKHAEAVGVKAIAAIGPYYYTHNTDDLKYFYNDLINSVNIPVYIYNNPKFQGYEISLKTMKELKQLGACGVKDATFDIITHATYHRLLKDEKFDVVLGTEAMWTSARALGCESFIPGLANAFPEINVKMHREGMKNDFELCRRTQFMVNELREIMYIAKSTQLAVYSMLEIRDIIKSYPRAPFKPASEMEKAAIKKKLMELGVI